MYEMHQHHKIMRVDDFIRREEILIYLEPLPLDHSSGLTVSDIYFLMNLPSEPYLKAKRDEAYKKGVIAGDILATVYLIYKFNLDPEPSLKKAMDAVGKFYKTTKYGDGTNIPAGKTRIKQIWNEMKPVSHLWAASRLNDAYPYAEKTEIFSPDNFPRFLGVAKEVHNFGTTFISEKTEPLKPILDSTVMVELPDEIEPLSLLTDQAQFPDQLNLYIQEYINFPYKC